ncbi:MAG: hypothetical protein ACJ739_11655 [Acidimicrobiales bacterium]
MEKLVYGLWRRPDQDLDPIRATLLERVAPMLLDLDVPGLRVCVEEPEGKAFQVGSNPDGSLLAASVSFWIDSYDHGAPHQAAIGLVDAQAYGWLVAESESLSYGDNRTWPDGERSPGLSITTFFDKREGLSDEDFYRIWHDEHTPLSFEIHPLWLYVRNQVLRSITPGAPPVRGIVYEAVPTDKHLLDFNLFFGTSDEPSKLIDNIHRVNEHMDTFGNTATLQCVPMREWIFRTLST